MRRFVMIGFGVMLGAAGPAAQDVPALPSTAPAVAQPQQNPPPPPTTPPPTRTPAPGQGRGRGAQSPAPQPQPPVVMGTQTVPTPPPGSGPGAPGFPAAGGRGVEAPSSWQNIRIDITITDSLSADQQQRKSVSMLVLDNRSGQVRSMGAQGMINVDASPLVRPDGKIYLRITLEYNPDLNPQIAQAANTPARTSFLETLSLVINEGKPLLVSQAADPRSDRKVTVEVTATVQK